MKAINVVGFRGSGKTGLVAALARALKSRGRKVVIVKHCHAGLHLAPRDARFRAAGTDFALLADRETLVFSRRPRPLAGFLAGLEADFVLIEGFKSVTTMPRIVLARSAKERRALGRGLAVATLPAGQPVTAGTAARIARIAERKAFLLAGLACGECGRRNCAALAAAIVAGRAEPGRCRHLDPEAVLRVDGRRVPLNRFAARIVRNIVSGAVDALKSVPAGGKKVTVEFYRR